MIQIVVFSGYKMPFDIRSILTEEKDKFKFLDQINEGLIVVDLAEEIQYVNRRFCELTGYTQEELMGKHAVNLLIEKQELVDKFRQSVEERKQLRSSSFEVEMVRKDGEKITVINSGSPVTDTDGNVIGSMGMLTVITEAKKNQRKLVQINKELSTFIYKVSHDLKGPIATTKGIINIVKSEADPSLDTYLNMLDDSVDKLNDVVDDLINIVFVRDGEVNPDKVDFDILFKDICREFELKLQKFKVSKVINQTGNFRSDPRMLKSVIRNIIQNAIYYNDSKEPEISVLIEAGSEKAMITVKDNGIGIAEEHLGKLFDMFYRGTEFSSGSGLGLYIVKQALDKLEGRVEIESYEGMGTEVRIGLKSL
jgi:PAS domain S-box-containing protein